MIEGIGCKSYIKANECAGGTANNATLLMFPHLGAGDRELVFQDCLWLYSTVEQWFCAL